MKNYLTNQEQRAGTTGLHPLLGDLLEAPDALEVEYPVWNLEIVVAHALNDTTTPHGLQKTDAQWAIFFSARLSAKRGAREGEPPFLFFPTGLRGLFHTCEATL